MAGVTAHRAEHNREDGRSPEAAPVPARRAGGFEGYDAARTSAAVHDRGPRGLIAIAGTDAVSFLHGILTNDIQRLEPGEACYAAYLTPQGRMLADMDVLQRGADLLLDVEPGLREDLAGRLDQSLFTEDVRIADRSGDLGSLALYGPRAAALLESVFGPGAEPGGFAAPAIGGHVTVSFDGAEVLVLGTDRGGVDGFHLFTAAALEPMAAMLAERGAARLGPDAAESLRIEGGIPRYGTDMTGDTIPLEAGIERRAISMTKGCYVGQEVIVRILHRGQGRVARRLVGLRAPDGAAPVPGARLEHEGRDAGWVTSSIVSPRLGAIALGYVHRDLVEPGTVLTPAGSDGGTVSVASLPFDAHDTA